MSLQDPWSPVPPPRRANQRLLILGGAGAASVLVVIVLALTVFRSSPSRAPSLPSASPHSAFAGVAPPSPSVSSGSPGNDVATTSGLLGAIPAAFRPDCANSSPGKYLDKNMANQVVCQGMLVPNTTIIDYGKYARASDADAFFAGLLQANALQVNQGKCSSLTLSGMLNNGNYCEEGVVSGGKDVGRTFAFVGTDFILSSGNDVSNYCNLTGPNPAFTVFSWTDVPHNLLAVAITCNEDPSSGLAFESGFFKGSYDLTH